MYELTEADWSHSTRYFASVCVDILSHINIYLLDILLKRSTCFGQNLRYLTSNFSKTLFRCIFFVKSFGIIYQKECLNIIIFHNFKIPLLTTTIYFSLKCTILEKKWGIEISILRLFSGRKYTSFSLLTKINVLYFYFFFFSLDVHFLRHSSCLCVYHFLRNFFSFSSLPKSAYYFLYGELIVIQK